MLERKTWVRVWAGEPGVQIIDTATVGVGVLLENAGDVAWRNLFASSEGADEYGAQLTAEGVWLATQPGNVAAALDWLHEAIDTTNVLRQQLEAEADAVEKEIVEWERGREDAS